MPTADRERVIRRVWNRPQSQFLRIRGQVDGPVQYVDLEGAIGSGKTTAPAWKLVDYVTAYPGIHTAICAWTDEMLGPPKSAFLEAAREQGFSIDAGTLTWHGGQGEEYYLVEGYGSRVYIRSMKASEDDMRYLKLAGLNLSIMWIDQCEPIPQDVYNTYIPARLRQPGYPHEVWLSPNPLDESHWLSKEFPTERRLRPVNYHYIRTTLYDNRAIVGDQFVADMEQKHPVGSALRHRFIDGTRGPMSRGTPVYQRLFSRATHLSDRARFTPLYPLLEGWDFGEEKPAVVWMQYLAHLAAIRILGCVKGSEVFLEQFAPRVIDLRRRLFPHFTELRVHCDPSGAHGNGGLQHTPVTLLRQLGVPVRYDETANTAPVRATAIQTIGGYLTRQGTDGQPGCLIAPRSLELVWEGESLVEQDSDVLATAFEAGYIWDDKAPSDAHPNIRKPKKGTRYDDCMNALEYIVIGEGIPLAPSVSQLATAAARYQSAPEREALRQQIAERLALRTAQRDTHPIDAPRGVRPGRYRNRAGY